MEDGDENPHYVTQGLGYGPDRFPLRIKCILPQGSCCLCGDRGYDPQTIMEATDRQLERALRGVLNGQDFRME